MTALSSSEQLQLSATIKRQALIWLAVSLILSGLLLVLWLYGNSIATESVSSITASEKSAASLKAVHISERIDKLDDLNDDVAPIEFKTVVRDMRDYPDEFKDKIYINNNKGKWTLQVMSVSEHDIIRDYLQGRDDRDKFAYFRYTDENNKSKYMLTYGLLGSLDEAMIVASEVDFDLPKSVKITPEEIKRYASMIDSYERSEAVLDMSRNRPRSINLLKTKNIVPVPVKKRPTITNNHGSQIDSNNHSNSNSKKKPKVNNNYSYKKPATANNIAKSNNRSVAQTNSNVANTNNSYSASAPVQTKKPKYVPPAPAKKQPTQMITKSLGNEPTLSLGAKPKVAPPSAPKARVNPQPKPKPVAKPVVQPEGSTRTNYLIRNKQKEVYNDSNNVKPYITYESKQFVPNSAPTE